MQAVFFAITNANDILLMMRIEDIECVVGEVSVRTIFTFLTKEGRIFEFVPDQGGPPYNLFFDTEKPVFFKTLSGDLEHTLALDRTGNMLGWGRNAF